MNVNPWTRGINLFECYPFSLDFGLNVLTWIECFWVVDVYRDIYHSLLCAVKDICQGLAVDEYFCNHGYTQKRFMFIRGQYFFHPLNDNHDMFLHVRFFYSKTFNFLKIILDVDIQKKWPKYRNIELIF